MSFLPISGFLKSRPNYYLYWYNYILIFGVNIITKRSYKCTIYLSFFLYVEILLHLVGKVLDNRKILSFGPKWTKLSWYTETEVVKKSKIINMKSAKTNHGLKTVFNLVLVVNIWWFIKIWSHKIPTIYFYCFHVLKWFWFLFFLGIRSTTMC